ncbi:MAG: hypothetical protein J3K34DRAFT_523249 [Monoraphidium minutum]|nr:MAG: hypothetical protein J3K34DRAFT_523249 [Monoraphidium minutum]
MVNPGDAKKRYWSYEQVHDAIRHAVCDTRVFDGFVPTLMLAIGGGGYIPTRIARTYLHHTYKTKVSVQAVGLSLYESEMDGCDVSRSTVKVTQWLTYGGGPGSVSLSGQRILIVDEVDDSRKTLAACVAALQSDIDAARAAAAQSGADWEEPEVGIFVLAYKRREKLAELPADIMKDRYWAAIDMDDCWCVFPWDAHDIYDHTRLAEGAAPGAAADPAGAGGAPPKTLAASALAASPRKV